MRIGRVLSVSAFLSAVGLVGVSVSRGWVPFMVSSALLALGVTVFVVGVRRDA